MEALYVVSEEEKKLRKYISWAEFTEYLISADNCRGDYDILLLLDSIRGEPNMGLHQLPSSICEMLTSSFDKVAQGK